MSFILDALKKSESERLKRDAPGFADLPQRSRVAGTPRWIWVLAVLLLVNAVVVGSLLLRPEVAPPGAEAAGGALPPAAAVSEPATPPPAREIEPPSPPVDPVSDAATTAVPASPSTSDGRVTPSTAPAMAAERPPPAAASGLPTFAALRADGTLSLPDLHLDIHVYSSSPDERFVFVNMSKYRERDRLDEGPLVRQIGPDGVVLEYRDSVFLLPRE